MSQTLQIRAFFFNSQTDYLPYYKHFKISVNNDETAKDVLLKIKEQNENFSFPNENLFLKINDLVTEGSQSIGAIVKRLGTDLQIDPVKAYRSNNGLIINDDDFMASYALLAPYASDADLTYYKTLYGLHYASETENYDHSYIGDAILMLAHKMISEGSEYSEEILKTISTTDSGLMDCEYENNLFDAQDHTDAIEALKVLVNPEPEPSLCSKLLKKLSKKEASPERKEIKTKTIKNLKEKQVAYYAGLASHEKMHDFLQSIKIHEVHFAKARKLAGFNILKSNKTLALKKAGAILLDAYDSGAEVLIVEDHAVLDMFLRHFCDIEDTIGRKMIGLELISSEDFMSQLK